MEGRWQVFYLKVNYQSFTMAFQNGQSQSRAKDELGSITLHNTSILV